MRIERIAGFVLLSGAIFGCKTGGNKSVLQDLNYADFPDLKTLDCGSNDPVSFVMKPAGKELVSKDFPELSDAPNDFQELQKDYTVVRLDGCSKDEGVTIERIMFGGTDVVKVATIATVPKNTTVPENFAPLFEGVQEAIYDQNYSKLNVRFPVEFDTEATGKGEAQVDGQKATEETYKVISQKAVYLRGSKDGAAASLALIDYDGKNSVYNDGFLAPYFAGVFEYEEPKKDAGTCASIATIKGSYKKGTFVMTWIGTASTGTSNGEIYNPCEITIVDTNKLLGKDAGKTIVLSKDDGTLGKALSVGSGHHGICYWANITTPGARYAFTSLKTSQDCPKVPYSGFKDWDKWQVFYGKQVVEGDGGYNFGNRVGEQDRMPLDVK